ncbi:MAG: hypothetical protein NWE76_00615 [Candidatus Bathyarchaeota archaeon]|nr:hypothetical protein [Candidatus Bathyarchaeota archaeon]
MGLFDRNWAGEALSRAASALAGFRYSAKEEEELTDEEKAALAVEEAEKLKAKEKNREERRENFDNFKTNVGDAAREVGATLGETAREVRERIRDKRSDREERRGRAHQERIAALNDPSKPDFEDGGVVPQEVPEDKLTELAYKIYADDAVMFGRDRKIANDWAAQISDESFIEGMVSVEAGEQEYIQLVEMLVQFIEMSKKYFRENYGTPEDEVQKGTFMSAYKRSKSGKNIYEQQGLKDVKPWSMYEQTLMKLESSDVSFRIESGIPTIISRGVIRPLAEDNRNPQPFMPQLSQIQQPESTMQ